MEEKNLNEELQQAEEKNELEVVEEEVKEEETAQEEYSGPVVTTQVRYDFRTMKYFNMYNMLYKRHFNVVYIVMGLLSLAFAAYQIYSGMNSEEGLKGINLILPIVFALFGAYFIYQSICFEKVIDKNITTHFMRNPKVAVMTVEVTEETVSIILPGREDQPFKYPWAYVTEIVEIPEYFFLYVQKQPIIIEKDPNKMISGEYETLERIIREQTNTKPYKKCDKNIVKSPINFVHPDDSFYTEVESEVESEVEETETEEKNEE